MEMDGYFSLTELDTDMKVLRNGLQEIEKVFLQVSPFVYVSSLCMVWK